MAFIKPPKFWINVPNGSVFSAIAEGTNDNFSIDMTVDSSGPDDEIWNHANLLAGEEKTLLSPNVYQMTVRINFAGLPEPAVTFRSRIVRPDGTVHDAPYEFTIPNASGSPYRALIGIVTVDGGEE
jgi:hypothetical protein